MKRVRQLEMLFVSWFASYSDIDFSLQSKQKMTITSKIGQQK
ncbi:hypothetical protein Nizo2776_1398 [Lactiplantibacillus plantarum]|nr:hypothetical protein Nizo2776_1398 [Lactiplantibacillus plantarum]